MVPTLGAPQAHLLQQELRGRQPAELFVAGAQMVLNDSVVLDENTTGQDPSLEFGDHETGSRPEPFEEPPKIVAAEEIVLPRPLAPHRLVVQPDETVQLAQLDVFGNGDPGTPSLRYLYKGPDSLLDAAEICAAGDVDFRLRFVGGGRYLETLRQDAARRGLGERVFFLGQLPAGETVRAVLDEADLFVLPSRSEGLPRAMIEAMARGLPCIGTRVGGVPELLSPNDLVPPSDAKGLASKIIEVSRKPQRLVEMSVRNLSQAQSYRDEVLRERRTRYYARLREVTERWLVRHVS